MDDWDNGRLCVKYKIPYSDLEQLPEERLKKFFADGQPLEFGHTLESQIGGQLQAGFTLCGLYEDKRTDDLLDRYIDTFIATRSVK